MKCLMCGTEMVSTTENLYHYKISGLSKVYLDGVTINKCENCGEKEVEIPNIEQLHCVLAIRMALKEKKLLPEEIRFLRTFLGFSGTDFARKIGTTHNTVSRWENGKRPMPETEEKLLRLMILTMEEPFTNYNLLDDMAVKESKSAVKLVLKTDDNNHWHEQMA